MKRNLLWLLLLVPAIFIAANNPFINDIESSEEEGNCVNYAEEHLNYDGNSGCWYFYDFSSSFTGNCTLEDIGLDRNTPEIQHYLNWTTAEIWTTGNNGIIEMLPKSGYGGPGFTLTCNIDVYFGNDIVEFTKWTCIVDAYAGPYPNKCD